MCCPADIIGIAGMPTCGSRPHEYWLDHESLQDIGNPDKIIQGFHPEIFGAPLIVSGAGYPAIAPPAFNLGASTVVQPNLSVEACGIMCRMITL